MSLNNQSGEILQGSSTRNIIKLWHSRQRNDMLKIFGILKFHGVNSKLIIPRLKKCVGENKTDYEIASLFANISRPIPNSNSNRNRRSSTRARHVYDMIKQSPVRGIKGAYLDIGSRDGSIAESICHMLGLNKNNTHATNIRQWMSHKNDISSSSHVQFSYITTDAKNQSLFPHCDDMFDIITIFQTLHHVKDISTMMKEIRRVCKPGGIVIIREHDVHNKCVHMLVDVEHLIYGVVIDKMSVKKFSNDYYGSYNSLCGWDTLFAKHGYDSICSVRINNPTRCYYSMFRKLV